MCLQIERVKKLAQENWISAVGIIVFLKQPLDINGVSFYGLQCDMTGSG